MKILFISYLFAPMNIIGAVRPTKIVDGLVKDGYIVDVVTSAEDKTIKSDGLSVPTQINNVYKIKKSGMFSFLAEIPKKLKKGGAKQPVASESTGVAKTSWKTELKKEIRGFLFQLFLHFDFLSFLKGFKDALKSGSIQRDYDVIYTSYGPLSSLLCGMYAKKKMPSSKWICEFRDPVVNVVLSKSFRSYYGRIQNKACRRADEIIAVSNGYVERICGSTYHEKAHMIPNGYDLKDKPENCKISSDAIELAYVGILYGGKRDLSPLFSAIRELIDENKIEPDKIIFNYAGVEFPVVKKQASQYGVERILKDYGVLARADCLDLQMSSHALVLSTWNDENEYGVFPGKFLEYMLMGKPIISVVDGNLKNSEVTQVIKEGNLGCSYESANRELDFPELKKFVYRLYSDTISGSGFKFSPSQEVLDRYNYDNIIRSIEALL